MGTNAQLLAWATVGTPFTARVGPCLVANDNAKAPRPLAASCDA
jgi:hypothetical protein